jgi:uncharacterized protein YjiS (DUF1127 family)
MLHRSRDRKPASTRPRLTPFQSKGRTENKETVAMKNLLQTLRQWQRGKTAARLLNRFDDHVLGDMGISRGDIRRDVHIFH